MVKPSTPVYQDFSIWPEWLRRPLRKLIYRLRYAYHLWRNVPWMTMGEALRYPVTILSDSDPIEDAECEMSYMGEG